MTPREAVRELPQLVALQDALEARAGLYSSAATQWGDALDVRSRAGRDAIRARLASLDRLRAVALRDAGTASHVLSSADSRQLLSQELEAVEGVRRTTVFEAAGVALPDNRVEHDMPMVDAMARLDRQRTVVSNLRRSVEQWRVAETFDDTVDRLTYRSEVAQREAALVEDVADIESVLVESLGEPSDWADRAVAIRAKLEWTMRMRLASKHHTNWGDRALAIVRSTPDSMEEATGSVRRWETALAELRRHFDSTAADTAGLADDLDAADLWLTRLRQTHGELDEVAEVAEALSSARRLGVQSVVQRAIVLGLASEQVPDYLVKCALECWLHRTQGSDARLRLPVGRSHDELVRRFRDRDRQLIDDSAARVIRAASKRRPNSQFGQSAVIKHEGQKKRKHIPVRELLARTADVVQAMHPVFMMSPLAVSQYLPADIEFDVVIFDEASQVLPGDTINCIYRAKSLITAGDQQQLPPTSFFAAANEDETDEENVASDFESILDLMKAAGQFPGITLRWHYRSRHEDLIAYSNASFYGHKLITFPGATAQSPDLGVKYLPAKGTYRRSGARDNPIEAAFVAERVLHHFDERPEQSLGVVAFSQPQATAIENAIERARLDRRDLDDHFSEDRMRGFFVKSLELVQGDERDVIIFSTGYGPDENGIVYKNFGPLNRRGGHRRLNVAVTRAKKLVELVSSMSSGDIGDGLAEGAQHLRRYMAFAELGHSALAVELGSNGLDAESPFEESVISVIRSWGYDVRPQVGVGSYRIDIGVRHPDKPGSFVLGVECDGAAYHSSRSARDRDRIRHDVLVGLDWNMHHIWGPDWYRKRSAEEARLRSAIEDAVAGRFTQHGIGPQSRIEVSTAARLEPVRLSWTKPYRASKQSLSIWYDQIGSPEALPRLTKFVEGVAADEAPLTFDALKERLRRETSVARIGNLIESNLRRAITRAEGVSMDGDFILFEGREIEHLRLPAKYDSRPFDAVHDSELLFALEMMVSEARSIAESELFQVVARQLGTRVRETSRTRLRSLVVQLVERGRLRRTDVGLVPAADRARDAGRTADPEDARVDG